MNPPAGRSLARSAGCRFGTQLVLCHNDLLAGNILLSNSYMYTAGSMQSFPLTIIDYEYGSYNYRAFDIANHFLGKHRDNTASF
jgi:choline/ethanolamine kinase